MLTPRADNGGDRAKAPFHYKFTMASDSEVKTNKQRLAYIPIAAEKRLDAQTVMNGKSVLSGLEWKGSVLRKRQVWTGDNVRVRKAIRMSPAPVRRSMPVEVLREYTQETTLHGVRYMMKTNTTPLERLCWVVSVVAFAVCAGVFINSAWGKYIASPMITSVQTTHFPLYELPFPAITICPANKVRKTVGEEILARYLNVTLDNTTRMQLWHVMSVFSILEHPFYDRMTKHLEAVKSLWPSFQHFNVSNFMLQTLPTCPELFLNCYWHGKQIECCKVFHIQRCEAGFCYAFNSLTSDRTKHCSTAEELEERGDVLNKDPICLLRRTTGSGTTTGFEVYFKGSNATNSLGSGQRDEKGARILLHDPADFPDPSKGLLLPEAEDNVFTVKVSPSVTVSSEAVRNLVPDVRQCYFHDEKELHIHHAYTQYACLLECKLQFIASICHCRPYYTTVPEDVPECSLEGLNCIVKFEQDLRFFSPPAEDVLNPNDTSPLQCSYCLPTCRETTYQVQTSYDRDYHPSNAGARGYLDVYYKDLGAVQYQRQLTFDSMNLLVSFGGILGLFLGVSLLSVVEIGYYSMRLVCAVYYYIKVWRRRPPSSPVHDIPPFTLPAITDKLDKTEIIQHGPKW